MAALLIKALAVLIVLQLVIIVAVLVIDIVILKNQNNAADTTTIANTTALFSTTTTEFNDTITTTTITSIKTTTTTTITTTTTTTESKNITTTPTIDTTISTLSSTPEIVSSTSSTASVSSSAIDNTTTIPSTMTDCYDWLHVNGSNSSGIYQINPGYGLEPFDVYCDMTTDGGGWTVIQRQVDDSLEMWNNTWQQYKNGFNNGIDNGSLWLGNDRIHVMSQWNVTLRVEIKGERWPHTNPNFNLYGTYNFSISDEINNYTLQISHPIDGNAGDPYSVGFYLNNEMPFSTVDKDSSEDGSGCAYKSQYGGWWFYPVYCTMVALNGKYNRSEELHGFQWYSQATGYIVPTRSEMKIRPI